MSAQERRGRQRIVTVQAGLPRFSVSWGGQRTELQDLSLEGFAMVVSSAPASEQPFAFVIEHEGDSVAVGGTAQVVNYIARDGGGIAGCYFVALAETDRTILSRWLAGHVIACSALPLREEDAFRIVSGPSII